MVLGYSGGDFLYNGPLTNMARNNRDGVFNGLSVSLSGGTVVQVANGASQYYTKHYDVTGSYLTLSVGSTVPRIDLIYATGTSVNARAGTYPSTTEKPNPPQIGEGEIPLAYITIPSGATTIGASNVRDLRIDANVQPFFNEWASKYLESTYLSGNRPAGYSAPSVVTRANYDFFNSLSKVDTTNLSNCIVNINNAPATGIPKVFASTPIDSFPFTSGTTTANWTSGNSTVATSGAAQAKFVHSTTIGVTAVATGPYTNRATARYTSTTDLKTGSVLDVYFYSTLICNVFPDFSVTAWAGLGFRNDAGTEYFIETLTSGVSTNFYHLRIYPGSQLMDVYRNGSLVSTGSSLSSLSQYKFNIATSGLTAANDGNSATGSVALNFLSYNNAAITGTFVTSLIDTSAVGLAREGYFKSIHTQTSSGGSIKWEISTDSGANYIDISGGQWTRFATPGSSLKLRATIIAAGSVTSPSITEWGLMYDELEL